MSTNCPTCGTNVGWRPLLLPIDPEADARVSEIVNERLAGTTSRKMPQWVSVEERTPERWQECICAYQGSNTTELHTCRAILSWDGERWSYSFGAGRYPGLVTHWMALPEPPTAHST